MININVDSKTTSIPLGKRLENEARIISFDLSGFIAEYGEGTAVLMAKRSQDANAYPVGAVREGENLLWTVLNSDTEYKGQGKCELFWYVGETLAKSLVYSTYVENDIGEEGEVPEPYEGWVTQLVDTMNDKLDVAWSYVEDAEAWAKGTRDGEPVDPQDGSYHNNAKYWSEQSESAATEAIATLAQTIYIDANGQFKIHG